MSDYQRMAQQLLASQGGLGSVAIAPGQIGSYSIGPQQIGGPPAVMVQNLGQRPVDYTQAAYTQGGLTLCGFGSTTIPAGAQGFQVHIDVRRPFLPQSLWMPSTVLGLQIVDFIVEGQGLFANPGGQGTPNELVSEVSNMPQIQWMTLNPDTGGDFLIDNPTGGPLVFSGAFWGNNIIRTR